MVKSEYEISIWEDYLTTEEFSVPHYRERKIAIIGKNDYDSVCMAKEPKLIKNSSGTNSFTFKMILNCREDEYNDIIQQFYVKADMQSRGLPYFVTQSEELVPYNFEDRGIKTKIYKNPFLSLLINERKIKVKWEGKWYDFIIKDVQEDSISKTITYICQDQWADELSKTGYNIELSDDLQNNQGRLTELARVALQGTGWGLELDENLDLREKREEPVYEVQLNTDLVAINDNNQASVTIPRGSTILLYYSQIQKFCDSYGYNSSNIHLVYNDFIQFAYASNYQTNPSNLLVTNASYYHFDGWYIVGFIGINGELAPSSIGFYNSNSLSDENQIGTIAFFNGVSLNYRAYHLIRQQQSRLDTQTGKYCDVYRALGADPNNLMASGDTIYKYTSIQYKDPTVVNNLIFNGKGFLNTNGWYGPGISVQLGNSSSGADTIFSYLQLSGNITYYNNGLRMMSSYLSEGVGYGEEYIFRYKEALVGHTAESRLAVSVREYIYVDGQPILNPNSPEYFQITALADMGDWAQYKLTCKKSFTRTDIYNNRIGVFISVPNSSNYTIKEAQLFQLAYDENGDIIYPGEMDKIAVAAPVYTYYKYDINNSTATPEEIIKIYEGTTDWNTNLLEPVYNENFEKIRSINMKQSNRLNLIQKLAEIFECRVEFDPRHNSTGALNYWSWTWSTDLRPSPMRWIKFVPLEGEDIGIGFIYGIDLKGVKRTIKSNQVTTKLIVTPNANEFAENGICAIERSKENYPRAGFILNFDYYVGREFLDKEELYKDLYSPTEGLGYYFWLNKYNTQYDSYNDDYIHFSNELTKKNSLLTVYDTGILAATEEMENALEKLMKLLGTTDPDDAKSYIIANYNQLDSLPEANATAIQTYVSAQSMLETYNELYDAINTSIIDLRARIEEIKRNRDTIITQIHLKDSEFNMKYFSYIREGSWTGQEYIDDDLYYFDAEKQARLASRPVVTYDISVMRVNALEEFKNKKFNIGDISFIQDTEFFGYTYVNGVLTPYKEKISISEITSNFEEPEKDTIKVQNYRTEFEDLFQRLVSSMQDFQFRGTEYYRR